MFDIFGIKRRKLELEIAATYASIENTLDEIDATNAEIKEQYRQIIEKCKKAKG